MELAERILTELDRLRPGATLCPGELARRLGVTPAAMRVELTALHARGAVRISQRGEPADLRTLRGPYRVAPSRQGISQTKL